MTFKDEIRPGDVLLFRGRSFISWGIRFFDGSDVNHAAVAVKGGQLAEAAGSGLRLFDIGKAVGVNERTLVRRIKTDAVSEPIVTFAEDWAARKLPYAYQQILLLALLGLMRRLPLKNPVLRRATRLALDHGAKLLNSLVDSGKELMICSEFVYRCFDEAVDRDPDPYRIEIPTLVPTAAARSLGEQPRSLHPGSLADTVTVMEFTRGSLMDRPRRETSAENPEMVVAEAEADLEPAFEALAAELGLTGAAPRGLPPTLRTAHVSEQEMVWSARSFAEALTGSKTGRQELARGQASFLSVVADFVTPGDLHRSPSLFDVTSIPG